MSALMRLGAFAAVLAVVFVIALSIGRAVGPLDDGSDAPPRPPGTTVATTTTLHSH